MPAGLLLHFDGDFVDAYRGRDLSAFDEFNPPIAGVPAKFGVAAMDIGQRVAGTSEFPEDFVFGTGDFTITFQFFKSGGANQGGAVTYADGGEIWSVFHTSGEGAPRPRLNLGGTIFTPDSYVYSTGIYTHIAWIRYSGTLTLYADGAQIQQWSAQQNLGGGAGELTITGAFDVASRLDELLILQSALYLGAFPPPTLPYGASPPPAPESIDRTMPSQIGQGGGGSWVGAGNGSAFGAPPLKPFENHPLKIEDENMNEQIVETDTPPQKTDDFSWWVLLVVGSMFLEV